jgi:hypothetical protein
MFVGTIGIGLTTVEGDGQRDDLVYAVAVLLALFFVLTAVFFSEFFFL